MNYCVSKNFWPVVYMQYKISELKMRLMRCNNVQILICLTILAVMVCFCLNYYLTLIIKHNKINKIFRYHSNDTKADAIQELVERYKVNWSCTMSEDPWRVADNWINGIHIQPEKTPELGAVLRSLSTKKILHADTFPYGSQIKLILELEGGQKVIFKPNRSGLNDIAIEINEGEDRPNAEIAAYHLGRIMELRRVPVVAGRYINFEKEILPVATINLQKNIYLDENGNMCIKRRCQKRCSENITFACGSGNMLAGSMCLWLPSEIRHSKYPWNPIIKHRDRSVMNDSFCKTDVMNEKRYRDGHLLLDVIETAIFDFLIGNADRHVVNLLEKGNDTVVVILDNGKSFGNPFQNEELAFILGPLFQCCRMRNGTWSQMKKLQGILGQVLEAVLEQDPIAPILSEENLLGINRRLKTSINAVQNCIALEGEASVIITDRKR